MSGKVNDFALMTPRAKLAVIMRATYDAREAYAAYGDDSLSVAVAVSNGLFYDQGVSPTPEVMQYVFRVAGLPMEVPK